MQAACRRCLGIPLMFLLTVFRRLGKLLGRSGTTIPRRILFIELSQTGSAILADPAMKKAAGELNAEIFFLISRKDREVLDIIGTVRPANRLVVRQNNILLLAWDTMKFLFLARRRKIDTVVDLQGFSRFTALLSGLCGAVNRAGFYRFYNEGLYRGDLLTHRVIYNPHIHIAKNYIALVNSLLSSKIEIPYSKQPVTDEEIVLPVKMYHETEIANMHEMVRRHYPDYERGRHNIVLINPGTGALLPQRRWMPDRYVLLIRRILENASEGVVLITGAPAMHDDAENMRQLAGSRRCINFAGAVRIEQLPVLYTISALMVTGDSGPSHFAAVTGLPTFVLYGPETPKLYGALGNSTHIYAGLACSPCLSAANHRRTPCSDNKCLQAVSVDQVFKAIRPVLLPESGNDPQVEKNAGTHRQDG
jgi:ADP-heptose:LPS heptosyltransferase